MIKKLLKVFSPDKLGAKILLVNFVYEFGQVVPNDPFLTIVYSIICVLANILLGVYILDGFEWYAEIEKKKWYRLLALGLFAYFWWAIYKDWTTWSSIKYVAIDTLFLCVDSYIMQNVFGWFGNDSGMAARKIFSFLRAAVRL